jgi:histidinol-phosphate aminotransferase
VIPLDRNESYWLLDDELVREFSSSGKKDFSTYPDYAEFKNELARYVGVDVSQLCITPGSDAAIQTFAQACVGMGGEAILPVPTFYGYESILERVGAVITPVHYTENDGAFIFPIEGTLEALRKPGVKALFLCQPNNPLGCNITDTDAERLISAAKENNVLLVSDEAYFEFSGKTLLPLLSEMSNLIIIRTLSKGFGLSGARIGYCIAAPEYIQKMEALMLPWPVANQSLFAARTALAHTDHILERLQLVIQEREKFINALKEIKGVIVYGSETNFVLIRVPSAVQVMQALLTAGIKVALGERMSRFPEAKSLLSNTLRVAIPSPEHVETVLNCLRESLFTKLD